MIKKLKLNCPNPKCRNGKVTEIVGFAAFTEKCPTCRGYGYVIAERDVPDVIIEHHHHYH